MMIVADDDIPPPLHYRDKKKSLLDLPVEMLTEIFRHLPFPMVTSYISFLSGKAWKAAKACNTWTSVGIHGRYMTLDDVRAVYQTVSKSCSNLDEGVLKVRYYEEFPGSAILEHTWPKLQNLVIRSDEPLKYFFRGLQESKFTMLTSLIIYSEHISLEGLENCSLPRLKELHIQVHGRPSTESNSGTVFSGMTGLEKLYVLLWNGDLMHEAYSPNSTFNQALAHGHLPNLKQLQVIGDTCGLLDQGPGFTSDEEDATFSHHKLERLSIDYSFSAKRFIEGLDGHRASAPVLFRQYQNLRSLHLPGPLMLENWDSEILAESLGKLEELHIPSMAHIPSGAVSKMVNLVAVRVYLSSSLLDQQHNVMRELLKLPKLQVLYVHGETSFHALLVEHFTSRSTNDGKSTFLTSDDFCG